VLDLDLATAVLQVAVSAQGVPATRGVVSVAPVGTDRGAVDVPITAGLARARLLRGTYRVGYEHTICGDPEPCGWHRLPDAIDLRSDGAVELTVPLIELVGTTTLDGAPTPLGWSSRCPRSVKASSRSRSLRVAS
jgi:hypothetical protein